MPEICGDCGGVRFIDTRRREDVGGDARSCTGVCGRLRGAGEIRLSRAGVADGGKEKDAELLGERSPPPDPSEEAAREWEVGGFKRDAESGCPFQR